jgi:hypothetical protein
MKVVGTLRVPIILTDRHTECADYLPARNFNKSLLAPATPGGISRPLFKDRSPIGWPV